MGMMFIFLVHLQDELFLYLGVPKLTLAGLVFSPSNSTVQGHRVGDGLIRGKVNRRILEALFGESLMASIAEFNRKRAKNNLLRDADAADADSVDEDMKQGQDEDSENFVGTDETAGKLQVRLVTRKRFCLGCKRYWPRTIDT